MSYSVITKPVSSLCTIQSGYTARRKINLVEQGGVPAIQLRDLGDSDEFDPSDLPSYSLTSSFERYKVGPGDILFRSRGDRNTAVMIAPSVRRAAVAILPLLVLRADHKLIDPKYLTWFINQPSSQHYFDKCARGTRLRMIPKKCLEDIEVPVPNLATQQLVVDIDMLAHREYELTRQIAEKKLEFTRFTVLEQVRKSRPLDNGAGQSTASETKRAED